MENTASTLDVFAVHELALEERNETADAFDVFKQDVIMPHALAPGESPLLPAAMPRTWQPRESMSSAQRCRTWLNNASDADLTKAYQQSCGEVGHRWPKRCSARPSDAISAPEPCATARAISANPKR
jgi:hypothetical protein